MKSLAFDGDYKVTSPYGWRTDPITGLRSFHDGIDVATPMRTPLKAREAGTVRTATVDDYGGKYIQVKMSDGRGYWQLHLDEMIVKKGATVKKGQLIGYSGNTGNSTGSHTHFGLQSNAEVWNSNIDPLTFFTLEVTESAQFKKGDKIIFTDVQNIRVGSGTSYEVNSQSVAGQTGFIYDNPRVADGYTWYDIHKDDGKTGWCADVDKFKLYSEDDMINAELQKQVETLTKEVVGLNQTITDQNKIIETLNKQVAIALQGIENLTAEKEQLNKDITEQIDKYESLKKEKNKIEAEKNEAVQELKDNQNITGASIGELFAEIWKRIMRSAK